MVPESIAVVMIAETITAEDITMAVIMTVVMMNAGTGIRGAKYTIMW
jgi:hypothetical protein